MKILSWNCRGLNSARAVRELLDIQKCYKPDVFFLSETHLSRVKAEKLRKHLGCDQLIIHESDGRGGGLVLLWRNDLTIREVEVTPNYIDVIIQDGVEWRLTGIYGEPRWDQKERTWAALRSIKSNVNEPWIVIGDFNEILYNHEKEGGQPRSQRQLQAFHDALAECVSCRIWASLVMNSHGREGKLENAWIEV